MYRRSPARRAPTRTVAYVEVHIEQGPVLERSHHAVGIVTGIVGATRGSVEIKGTGGHAGGVPMRLRRDALIAAAEMLLAVESRAREDHELVATIGQLEVPEKAPNTIPVWCALPSISAALRTRVAGKQSPTSPNACV
jgi:allantoate deiminase